MALKIRMAKVNDAETIERLYKELVSDSKIRVLPERVAELEVDPNAALFVAEFNGIVCGTAFVYLCQDLMYGVQPFSIVENIVVSSAYQGKGIGRSIFSHVEKFCIDSNCSKIMLLSSAARVESHNFFEKLGFKGDVKRGFVKYRSSLVGATVRP